MADKEGPDYQVLAPISVLNKGDTYPAHNRLNSYLKQRYVIAHQRVTAMDGIDGAPISEGFLDNGLRTVMDAMVAGLNRPKTDAVLDALVMLQQIERMLRERAYPVMEVVTKLVSEDFLRKIKTPPGEN